jgi:hypothetical protein
MCINEESGCFTSFNMLFTEFVGELPNKKVLKNLRHALQVKDLYQVGGSLRLANLIADLINCCIRM